MVLITACGNKKESVPTVAGKLYKSTRIRYLYKKSKELNIPFYILSAKYGLVNSDKIISSYNQIMDDNQCIKLKSQIKEVLKNFDIIIYYKGGAREIYFNCLKDVVFELNKKFIYFGYANMGDIKKIDEIIMSIDNGKWTMEN